MALEKGWGGEGGKRDGVKQEDGGYKSRSEKAQGQERN
jgi:hypothetical protein